MRQLEMAVKLCFDSCHPFPKFPYVAMDFVKALMNRIQG